MQVTFTEPKRLIYFIGHPNEKNSALITQICNNYSTIFELYNSECATRTLYNLYNLHAVRGLLDNGKLIFNSSMSGPHHYFGYINPTKCHTIKIVNNMPVYIQENNIKPSYYKKLTINSHQKVIINNYNWIKGNVLLNKLPDYISNNIINVETGQVDSLFDKPGIIELTEENIDIPVIINAYMYDLSKFRAQIVKNDTPFSFNQLEIQKYNHAQHKLRVITYNYGDNYLDNYLMSGNGVFIEKHEFIQAITPMNEKCGGYVIFGYENNNSMELIAVTIPFGYTLLVEPWAIHGDSTLTGMYMMAMTGNHNAMKTADTVYIKNRQTLNNVKITTTLPKIEGLEGNKMLLTSNIMTLNELKIKNNNLKKQIINDIGIIKSLWWQTVILTGNKNNKIINKLGWTKTLGSELPE